MFICSTQKYKTKLSGVFNKYNLEFFFLVLLNSLI